MRHIFQYIILAMTLSVISFSLNSCGRKNVIEEDHLAHIYAEMLMTDQWINATPGARLIADTSLVYEPILRKYGYTSEDYRNTVEYYLQDPDDYADIMKMTVDILDARLVELRKLKDIEQEDKVRADFLKKVAREIKLDNAWLFVDRLKDERYGMIDSLSVELDTLTYTFRMVSVPWSEKPDTLQVSDSLAVLDSLPPVDSLDVKDTLPTLDTIRQLDFPDDPVKSSKTKVLRHPDKSLFKKNSLKKSKDSLSIVK